MKCACGTSIVVGQFFASSLSMDVDKRDTESAVFFCRAVTTV